MQIKTTMRYHFTPVRIAIIKKSTNNAGEDVEKREPLYTVAGNVNWCSHYGKQYGGYLKNSQWGLPWWHSGWESACQCRGHGFEPWSGRIPRAAEQLGPWATTAEPAHLEPVLRNGRGRGGERPAHRNEEWPLLAAAGEGPRTETKTQHSQK